jgi:hypothetical protein
MAGANFGSGPGDPYSERVASIQFDLVSLTLAAYEGGLKTKDWVRFETASQALMLAGIKVPDDDEQVGVGDFLRMHLQVLTASLMARARESSLEKIPALAKTSLEPVEVFINQGGKITLSQDRMFEDGNIVTLHPAQVRPLIKDLERELEEALEEWRGPTCAECERAKVFCDCTCPKCKKLGAGCACQAAAEASPN